MELSNPGQSQSYASKNWILSINYYFLRTEMSHSSTDGTGEHYAKWNKSGGERQIPYDFTYKWNLIQKTDKQVKYNQRHWNKQTDSNQRGRGEGNNGEKLMVIKEHV